MEAIKEKEQELHELMVHCLRKNSVTQEEKKMMADLNKEIKAMKRKYNKEKKKKKTNRTGGSQIQSLMFEKHLWSIPKAVEWLQSHGYGYEKVDVTDNFYRFRQFAPRGQMRTITFSDEDGIKAVISYGTRRRSKSPAKRKKSPAKRKKSPAKRRKSPAKRRKSRKRSPSKKR